MKRTKGFVKFHSRVEYFSTDIELADLVVKNIQLLKGENVIFKDLKPTISPNLAKYHNLRYKEWRWWEGQQHECAHDKADSAHLIDA